ncbi:MAG: response regulator [Verrucomicrobia bacterium]|nr:response regulator [Verrucomicrobiota bacterium]
MNRVVILCVEDESEVREAIVRDLDTFAEVFRIEEAEDAADAKQVMADCVKDGDAVGLVLCDHLLPGEKGVDFLVELNEQPETHSIRKVLVTGQAGLEDTIKAVNDAGLDHYIAKPWKIDELHEVVKEQLTDFVLKTSANLLPYVPVLDGTRLMEAIAHGGRTE